MKIVLVAAVALIDPERRILLAQRPPGKPMAGLWEFPGGKVEPEETPEAALIRELQEELGIAICRPCLSAGPFVSHSYSNTPPAAEPDCGCPVDDSSFIPAAQWGISHEFHLLMTLYLCRKWTGTPSPREGQILAWRTLHEIADMPMPPADIPLLAGLRAFL